MTLLSRPGQTAVLAAVCAGLGLLLIAATRDYAAVNSNEFAGFMLGMLLFCLGVAGLAVRESRRIELDEGRRRIVLEISRRIGGSRRIVIPFSEIEGFGIGLQGKPAAGTRYYDLTVRTRNGEEIHLMGGCAFQGRMDRAWIDRLRAQFERAVS